MPRTPDRGRAGNKVYAQLGTGEDGTGLDSAGVDSIGSSPLPSRAPAERAGLFFRWLSPIFTLGASTTLQRSRHVQIHVKLILLRVRRRYLRRGPVRIVPRRAH